MCVCTRVRVHTCVCVHMYACVCVRAFVHACMHAHMCVCVSELNDSSPGKTHLCPEEQVHLQMNCSHTPSIIKKNGEGNKAAQYN